jgi:ATPase subunit of ABC transporter with duplicated ATPase domains
MGESAMITVSGVSKGFGGTSLFKDVSCSFSTGTNYGLTGPNGSGKSTFMRILVGAEPADTGDISLPERTAWLRQDHFAFDAHTVLDTVLMGNPRLWAAMAEKEVLYSTEELTDEDGDRLGELECVVAEEDGYSAEADAAVLLSGLGIGDELFYEKMANVQGGIKLRILLAQALFGQPEALLLDEPTNHLDMESIIWVEEFLSNYHGVLVVISHDRRFLNAVCDQIADIDFETIITYPGNYDDMVRQKAQIRGRLEKEKAGREKKIAQLKDFVARFSAGTRASQTKSRKRQIQKLAPHEIKRSNIKRPFIRFTPGERPSGRDVLQVRNLSKSWGDEEVFSNFHAEVHRGDKVAILGRNGIGKTTLIKELIDDANLINGTVHWGHNVRLGYFGHDHRDMIEKGTTVFQWLFSQRPEVGAENVRAILGRMLFSGADGAKPTSTLSGGEGARLVLCNMILQEYNTLLLDEPTDHLDLESISSLKDAIEAFEGTVFFVTHDRELASAATCIWSYPQPQQLLEYRGPLDEYLTWYDQHYLKRTA